MPKQKTKLTGPKTPEHGLWVSVSEAAKLGGVQTKTIRRAIEAKKIAFKVKNNRYLIDFGSLLKLVHSSPVLKKRFEEQGLGQYFK